MKLSQIDKMKETALRAFLKRLIKKLDELDDEDFFGTNGWRYFLLGDDE
jgi:hypothetical protein